MDASTPPDQTLASDVPYDGMLIRAKWVMDGAKTLSEAAALLRAEAAALEEYEAAGWQLDGSVEDDYGAIFEVRDRN